MTLVVSVLGWAALAIGGIRWLRVAQREHYLPGSVLTMMRLWATSTPANVALALLPVGGVLVLALSGATEAAALLAVVGVAAFPLGLGIRGRTAPVAWTARMRRVAALAFVVAVGLSWLAWLVERQIWDGPAAFPNALALAAFPLAVEAALWVGVPLERRLSQTFVDRAAATLRRVGPTIVGITGSYGKTSTKHYVATLVEGTRRVVASPASFNNRLGLARAVNEHLTGDAEVFVAEMGTYGPGEIADLCSWVPPDIAVMTAIGPVHLERFKTEDNIVVAKSEILAPASVAVFNVDHPALAALADQTAVKTVWRCGTSEAANDVRVAAGEHGETRVSIGGEDVGPAPAGVFASNLACAVAVALELGVPQTALVDRLAALAAPEHRQTVSVGAAGFTIIDDTFNANPAGAARAVRLLSELGEGSARRVVVTPGMVELGPRQDDENGRFAALAAEVADDLVIVGRTNRRSLQRGAAGGRARVIVVSTRQDAVEWVRSHLEQGDVVLYENDLPDHYP